MKFPLLASITFVFILAAGTVYYLPPSFLFDHSCNAQGGENSSQQYCCQSRSPAHLDQSTNTEGKTCNIFGKRIERMNSESESFTCANSGAFRNLLFKRFNEACCSTSYYAAKLTTYFFLWKGDEADKVNEARADIIDREDDKAWDNEEEEEEWEDEEEEWDEEQETIEARADIIEREDDKAWNNEEEEWEDEEEEWDEEQETIDDIWDSLVCPEIFSTQRPIHSQETWNKVIDIYNTIVEDDGNLDPLKNGFSVGIEAKQTEFKGRGIYATHAINKGDLIWSTTRTARFGNADDYRQFLSMLDADFACDVLQWAYVQDLSDSKEHEELRISVDLDEGCFCNGEGSDESDELSSVGCDEDEAVKYEGGCTSNYFALRGIAAGEELICNYGEFVISHGWGEFGLQR